MTISFKSFVGGVLLGAFICSIIPALAMTAKQSAGIEKTISNFIHSLECHNVDVQDIDLWEGKVLVKARKLNISFVMTALDSASYEICPVGLNVNSLKVIPAKP